MQLQDEPDAASFAPYGIEPLEGRLILDIARRRFEAEIGKPYSAAACTRSERVKYLSLVALERTSATRFKVGGPNRGDAVHVGPYQRAWIRQLLLAVLAVTLADRQFLKRYGRIFDRGIPFTPSVALAEIYCTRCDPFLLAWRAKMELTRSTQELECLREYRHFVAEAHTSLLRHARRP